MGPTGELTARELFDLLANLLVSKPELANATIYHEGDGGAYYCRTVIETIEDGEPAVYIGNSTEA